MKRMAIYGDSISAGGYGNGGYEEKLKQTLKLDHIYNYAVSSSGVAGCTPNNLLTILEEQPIPADAELFLVWHGSNDWFWGSEPEVFRQAVADAVGKLRQAVPDAPIVWVTPIYRCEQPHNGTVRGDAGITVNRVGQTMAGYVRVLAEESITAGFDLLDMGRLCGITADNAAEFLEDFVHPNEAGYDRMVPVLAAGIKKAVGA